MQEGGKVTIADILEDEAKKTVKELREQYGKGKVHFAFCDVTMPRDFVTTWDSTEEFFKGKVYGLVNNAGINGSQGWKLCMDINMVTRNVKITDNYDLFINTQMGVMHGTNLANERLTHKKGGKGGIVINTASVAGLMPCKDDSYVPYFVSKHGVVALTRAFGTPEVFARDGIRHVCICPSFTETNMIADPALFEWAVKRYGRHNILNVDKVVDGFITLVKVHVLFLASDNA